MFAAQTFPAGSIFYLYLRTPELPSRRSGAGRFDELFVRRALRWHCRLSSAVPTIGASGAIAGVLGAYFVLFPYARVITLVPILLFPLFFEVPAVFFLAIWFFGQLLSGTISIASGQYVENVAWWAHIGGFLAGILLLPVFKKSEGEYRKYYPDEYWPY